MSQPWGLSGPEFLGVYGAGIVVMIIGALLVRRLVQASPGRGREALAGRELDAYQVGYLAGGARRVAQVLVTRWTESGVLRVNSQGRISVPSRALAGAPANAGYGVQLGQVPDGARTDSVLKAVARDPAVASIGRELRAAGLAVSEARLRVLRLGTTALVAGLLGTGIARFIEAAHNHRPAGELGVLFAFSVVIGLIFIARAWGQPPIATTAGARYLRDLRPRRQGGTQSAFAGQSASAGPAGEAALFGVALLGFTAITDSDLRSSLEAGIATSSSSGGSSCSSGSSCGGGCGGGGCGG